MYQLRVYLENLEHLIGNPYFLAVGSLWFIFGTAEFLIPQVARMFFDLLLRRPKLLPIIRIALGILIILGSLQNNNHRRVMIGLGFLCEATGLIQLFLSDEGLKEYIYWLRSRPKLTFRLLGAANIAIAVFILLRGLF